MPLYEYHCQRCGKDHEILQKLSDSPLKFCPACQGPIEKKVSLSSFQLKGGGWYKEGYTSAPSKPKEAKGTVKKEEPKKEEKKEVPKSEGSKSEAPKSETKNPGG